MLRGPRKTAEFCANKRSALHEKMKHREGRKLENFRKLVKFAHKNLKITKNVTFF
jgi:hypothetical protein